MINFQDYLKSLNASNAPNEVNENSSDYFKEHDLKDVLPEIKKSIELLGKSYGLYSTILDEDYVDTKASSKTSKALIVCIDDLKNKIGAYRVTFAPNGKTFKDVNFDAYTSFITNNKVGISLKDASKTFEHLAEYTKNVEKLVKNIEEYLGTLFN